MKHLLRHIPNPCLPSRRRGPRQTWKLLLIPIAGVVLACASCSDSAPPPSSVPVTDTVPVGDGLKVIGFSLLAASVVAVLGKLMS